MNEHTFTFVPTSTAICNLMNVEKYQIKGYDLCLSK